MNILLLALAGSVLGLYAFVAPRALLILMLAGRILLDGKIAEGGSLAPLAPVITVGMAGVAILAMAKSGAVRPSRGLVALGSLLAAGAAVSYTHLTLPTKRIV